MLQLPLNILLDDSAKFANFYSVNNAQLVSKLKNLSSQESQFIFIWGASQTGKTHLAQALCHEFEEQGLAAYLPLENPALNPQVLEGMDVMDLVCLDNIDKIVGIKTWEVALFDLYNQLKLNNKHLVIFSETAAAGLAIELADLKSRLNAMEIYRLSALDDSQKSTWFKVRAENRGLEIPDEVVSYLLARQSRSLDDLLLVLDKIDRSSIALKRKVTIPLVKSIL